MVEEMAALHSTGTWDLVTLPAGKSLVGCRWVYTVKIGLDSRVDHLKARLVTNNEQKIEYINQYIAKISDIGRYRHYFDILAKYREYISRARGLEFLKKYR